MASDYERQWCLALPGGSYGFFTTPSIGSVLVSASSGFVER